MTENAALERRLIELEERYAHQERLLEELSSVLASHQRELDRLAREVKDLASHSEEGDQIRNERPPHY